jgi:hypothetical protein
MAGIFTTEPEDEQANSEAVEKISAFKLGKLPISCLARELRLKENDVLIAIDGKEIDIEPAGFADLAADAELNNAPLLLTIVRDGMIYDVLASYDLGVKLDYCEPAEAKAAQDLLKGHDIGAKQEYRNYEALRNIHRHVVVYDTEYSSLATMCPPAWLLQHRAWEPLAAVMAAYGASFVVHWLAFVATFFLLGFYFHRIQFRLIRNYSLFTEHYFWFVLAARSSLEAQTVLRKVDPKAIFDFSHVGPPIVSDNQPSKRLAA